MLWIYDAVMFLLCIDFDFYGLSGYPLFRVKKCFVFLSIADAGAPPKLGGVPFYFKFNQPFIFSIAIERMGHCEEYLPFRIIDIGISAYHFLLSGKSEAGSKFLLRRKYRPLRLG